MLFRSTPRPTATATPGVTPSPVPTATVPPATPAATLVTNSVVITETPEGDVTGAVAATSTPATIVTATPLPGGIGPGSTVINGIADANLRDSPALDAAVIATLPLGTELTVTGPSVAVDDIVWWPVTVLATGQTGFVAEDLLTPGAE